MSSKCAQCPAVAAILALIAGIFAIDWWLPQHLAITVLYVVPVLIASRISFQWLLPGVATLTSFLTLMEVARTPFYLLTWTAVCNRSFTLLVIWVTAVLCIRSRRDEEQLRKVYQAIEQQVEERTADLARANKLLDALHAEAVSQLAAIVMSSDDAIIGMTLNGIIRNWNAGAERVYGYSAEEMVGRSISLLCPPDRLDEVPAILSRIARSEHVRNVETVQRRKRGTPIDVSLTISPVKDVDGVVIGASSIARDITVRKRAEAALRESEARFHMMADTAPVMVWMAGPDGRCTFVNKRWLEFTGRALEKEIGDDWISGLHPTDAERCQQAYEGSFKTEQPFSMEYRLRRHDGKYRWVLDTGVPFFEPGGRFGGYIGTCVDMTERKDMEDQLRKALKEKESLLREVHHRVKNNLQVISSLLNLQATSIKDTQIAQLFRECQVRITSIGLLHDTLHRSEDLSHIAMGEYLRTLVSHLFRSYGVDSNRIAVNLQLDDVGFDLDTGLTCGLILEELVSNCLKHAFHDRQGTITITLQAHADDTYSLRVEDDGVGFPKDGILNNPDSLGLELVGLMAEKLDGVVTLQSGQGTEWQVRFRHLQYQERM
ncbi:MAG TPA: PAS domain S-box protein [Nitrospiraceae bacterium]|jgi:PAS domain S-box-containing protein